MHYLHQFSQVGLLQKLIVVVVLLSLLVSGDNDQEEVMKVGASAVSNLSPGNTYVDRRQQDQTRQPQRYLRHSFDAFFSSKRKVPNASDPLHNR